MESAWLSAGARCAKTLRHRPGGSDDSTALRLAIRNRLSRAGHPGSGSRVEGGRRSPRSATSVRRTLRRTAIGRTPAMRNDRTGGSPQTQVHALDRNLSGLVFERPTGSAFSIRNRIAAAAADVIRRGSPVWTSQRFTRPGDGGRPWNPTVRTRRPPRDCGTIPRLLDRIRADFSQFSSEEVLDVPGEIHALGTGRDFFRLRNRQAPNDFLQLGNRVRRGAQLSKPHAD
jgi:hypothetical protein